MSKTFSKKILAPEKIAPHTDVEEKPDPEKGSDERRAAVMNKVMGLSIVRY